MADDYSLRIYSGAHNGLVFGLRNGSYSIGSSDENDLIFNDLNMPEKAAVFNLTEDGIEVELFAAALLDGNSLEAGVCRWISGQFLQIGDTLFGYRNADIRGEWPQPQYKTVAESKPEEETAPEGEEGKAQSEEGKAEEDKAAEQAPDSTELTVQRGNVWLERYLPYWPVGAAAAVLIALLVLLIFGPIWFSTTDEERDLDIVQSALAAHNIENVVAEQTERGVALSGYVKSKAEYARLFEALPKLRTFLSVNVEVRDDEIIGVEHDFAALGFYVRARYIEDDLIAVEGYFKDAYVQADAFRAMEPKYRKRLRSRIVYQPELAATIATETSRRGISELKLLYADGEVFYSGKTTIDDDNDIEFIRHGTSVRLGIPLRLTRYDPKSTATIARFDGINVTEAAQSEAEIEQEQKEREKEAAVTRGFNAEPVAAPVPKPKKPEDDKEKDADTGKKPQTAAADAQNFSVKDIMGVTLKPMRFITLKNGRKYFEGGVLPNGYTVSKIDLDKVVITKGREVIELKITK